MSETIVVTPFDESKDEAVRDFERYAQETWEKYGVKLITLNEEMQTWYWKTVAVGAGNKKSYREIIEWKGIGITPAEQLEKRKQEILGAANIEQLRNSLEAAKRSAHTIACYLWSIDKAVGLNTPELMMKKAAKAESLAEYYEKRGKDGIAESQRKRADLLRRKASGEAIEIPKRASGAIDKARSLFAELEKDGKSHARSDYITAATASGIHPGTAAVQYARWKKERKGQAE